MPTYDTISRAVIGSEKFEQMMVDMSSDVLNITMQIVESTWKKSYKKQGEEKLAAVKKAITTFHSEKPDLLISDVDIIRVIQVVFLHLDMDAPASTDAEVKKNEPI